VNVVSAHSGDREHLDRLIVNTQIGDRVPEEREAIDTKTPSFLRVLVQGEAGLDGL
jgi:hypothetical protein